MNATAALALTLIVACSDAMPATPDAAPGPIDGDWNATWSCVSLCVPVPVIAMADRVSVAGGSVMWSSATCIECDLSHAGSIASSCVTVDAGDDNELDARGAYTICSVSDVEASGTVEVRRNGGLPQPSVWHVTLTRR